MVKSIKGKQKNIKNMAMDNWFFLMVIGMQGILNMEKLMVLDLFIKIISQLLKGSGKKVYFLIRKMIRLIKLLKIHLELDLCLYVILLFYYLNININNIKVFLKKFLNKKNNIDLSLKYLYKHSIY